MQISKLSQDGLTHRFSVIISSADVAREEEAELQSLGKRVKIPGFRPGNVPLKVLKERYGKGVRDDVLRNVINGTATKVVNENKLRPATTPGLQVKDYKEDGDLSFEMTVECLPEIPDYDYASLALTRETFEVADAEVDEALSRLAERSPALETLPEGAKAAKGNVVTMDFVGSVDGTKFEGGTAKDFKVEIGSGQLIDGFEDQLVGVKAGESRSLDVTFPENYFNKELAGKPARFEVTVSALAEKRVPPVDEAFATERGFKDLGALREAVRGQIAKEYHHVVRTRLKKRLFDTLEKMCDYALPESMVKLEFDAIWGRLQQAKEQNPDVLEGKSEEEVKKEYEGIAARRVRLGILLAELGARNQLQVTQNELSRAVMEHASQFPGQEQMVVDFYRKNPSKLDELRGPILEEKAVDWILSKAVLNDTPVDTKLLRESDESEDEVKPAKPAAKKKAAAKKKDEE